MSLFRCMVGMGMLMFMLVGMGSMLVIAIDMNIKFNSGDTAALASPKVKMILLQAEF